jgi:hypothetical protein
MHRAPASLSLVDTGELEYCFERCSVIIDPEGRTVSTLFEDGAEVLTCPNLDHESIARARSLGYRGSEEAVVWAMTADHDLVRTLVAEPQGHPWSATLHAVAHGYALTSGMVEQEERLVLLVQRLANVGLDCVLPTLSCHSR